MLKRITEFFFPNLAVTKPDENSVWYGIRQKIETVRAEDFADLFATLDSAVKNRISDSIKEVIEFDVDEITNNFDELKKFYPKVESNTDIDTRTYLAHSIYDIKSSQLQQYMVDQFYFNLLFSDILLKRKAEKSLPEDILNTFLTYAAINGLDEARDSIRLAYNHTGKDKLLKRFTNDTIKKSLSFYCILNCEARTVKRIFTEALQD